MTHNLRLDGDRLLARLAALGRIGDTGDGGVCRLALSEADARGRAWLANAMAELGLAVRTDAIGNMFGTLPGRDAVAPVMLGSHIDTVATGGRYDGALGVLAGLEVVAALREAGHVPRRPITVAAFTNEEGARFQPDMMGSCVHAGVLPLADALAARDADGISVAEALASIGAAGPASDTAERPHAYLELHIEQGPVLDRDGGVVAAVTGVQAIRWFEVTIEGESNHAGTTPIAYRRDAGFVAALLAVEARAVADAIDEQVATVGRIVLEPGQINVVARRAVVALDIRNPSESLLDEAERRVRAFLADAAARHGVEVSVSDLARFPAVAFDPGVIAAVEDAARRLGHDPRRMVSGAGHDAQIMAGICPAGMIFVPSIDGLSHNPAEMTRPDHLIAGAQVLLQAALTLAES